MFWEDPRGIRQCARAPQLDRRKKDELALSTGIERFERLGGGYRATTSAGGATSSRGVVLAIGAFQTPATPAIAKQLSAGAGQLTPEIYQNPETTPSRTILVVGDAASGRLIARELSETQQVLLAAGRPHRVNQHQVLGESIFWWMDKLGILRASRDSAIRPYLIGTDPFTQLVLIQTS